MADPAPLAPAGPSGVLDQFAGELTPQGIPVNANRSLLVASLQVKAGAGRLLGISVYNSNAATRWCLLFDQVGVPSNGAVPLMAWQIPTQSTLDIGWGDTAGRVFLRGILLVNSTTDATLTLGAADQLMDAQYV